MIRPELRRISANVRARLQSGEALTWRDVWAVAPDASRTWAHDTLRKLRQENILILMLGRNVTTLELMRHQKKSQRIISDDITEMIEAGHVFAFSADGSVDCRSRMYSLTKAGIERAKRLKEMSE